MTPDAIVRKAHEVITNNSKVQLGLVITVIVAVAGGGVAVGSLLANSGHVAGSVEDVTVELKILNEKFGSFLVDRAAFEANIKVRMKTVEAANGITPIEIDESG